MKLKLLVLPFLLTSINIAMGNTLMKVLQDPQTKTIYYIESDRCHVTAIDSHGHFLWCCDVIPPPNKANLYISSIGFMDRETEGLKGSENFIEITVIGPGVVSGLINKTTGMYNSIAGD